MAIPPLYPSDLLYPAEDLYPSDGVPDPVSTLPGGGGLGAQMGDEFLARYEPRYQGHYKPGYKSKLRKA